MAGRGNEVERGARVVLLSEGGLKVPVRAEAGTRKVQGIGVVDPGELVGRPFGALMRFGNRRFLVLRPSVLDRIETIHRRAQIVLPKDSAIIIMNCDVRPGSVVVEGGSGSGALTVALASAVGPDGRVFSYEIRPDHARLARENLEAAGLEDRVVFREADICDASAVKEREADAFVLDVPEPWNALAAASAALRPCGHFACYAPTANQVEQAVRALQGGKAGRFIEIYTIETLMREMTVVEKGIRPSFEMLGHSGYLTFARKVLEGF